MIQEFLVALRWNDKKTGGVRSALPWLLLMVAASMITFVLGLLKYTAGIRNVIPAVFPKYCIRKSSRYFFEGNRHDMHVDPAD